MDPERDAGHAALISCPCMRCFATAVFLLAIWAPWRLAVAQEQDAAAVPASPTPAATPAAAVSEEELSGLDVVEVVVTAQKRKEKIQEVPISVSALTEKFIEDSQLRDFQNVQEYVPNLTVQTQTDSRSTAIRIRGIGTPGLNAGFDPSVGVFHDGVYLGRPGMALTELLDIERIEVLRGPQGTLYGKNTAAGAINLITQKPTFDYEGFGEVVFGNYEDREVRGSINAPLLQDRIATRISGYGVGRDGFDLNTFTGERVNDQVRFGFRARTLFNVSDDFDVLVTGDYAQEND